MAKTAAATTADIDVWKARIDQAWQKSVQSTVDCGRLVKEAKEELGVSFALLETELPFSSTVAAFLIKIAEHPVLSNPQYFSNLPNGYNTLYHLSAIEAPELKKKITAGEVTANTTVERARALKASASAPDEQAISDQSSKAQIKVDVGVVAISSQADVSEFQADLEAMLAKYDGSVKYSSKDGSLKATNHALLLEQAHDQISQCESQLKNITLAELRMIEEAAHSMTTEKVVKNKQIVNVDGELVERVCLPKTHPHYAALKKLTGKKDITRGALKHWCVENKVPSQFLELSSLDKELYVWEQARLVLENKDKAGGLKRLKSMASRSTIPKMKALAVLIVEEITRFDNKQ